MWQPRHRRMEVLNDTKMWRNYKNFIIQISLLFSDTLQMQLLKAWIVVYIYYHIWLIYTSVGRVQSTTEPRWETNQWVDWTIVDWWVVFISFYLNQSKLWYGLRWMNVGPGARWSCSGHQKTSVGRNLSPPFSYSIHLRLPSTPNSIPGTKPGVPG